MENASLNKVRVAIEAILNAHPLIETVEYGELPDIATSETRFPLCFYFVRDSNISGSVLSYNFTFLFMDKVNKDAGNKFDVSSDQHGVARDIVARFRNADNDLWVLVEDNIQLNEFYERFDDEVTGWGLDVTLKTANMFNSCVPS